MKYIFALDLSLHSRWAKPKSQNVRSQTWAQCVLHMQCMQRSAALCFVLDPTPFNLQSPTYTCTWCMFSLAGCEGLASPMCTLGLSESQRVHQSLGSDSCLLHIGNPSHSIICTNNQITFQIIVQSPTTMWGMAKRALQLSFLLLVELPIRLLMLLVINVLGLILPELVVWVAKTTMIRHARSSS